MKKIEHLNSCLLSYELNAHEYLSKWKKGYGDFYLEKYQAMKENVRMTRLEIENLKDSSKIPKN